MDTGRVLMVVLSSVLLETVATVAASFSFETRKISLKSVPLQALCAISSLFRNKQVHVPFCIHNYIFSSVMLFL